ncbi:MAG: helix-turn-helix domain-containing protein [Spirochaetia bacterium]
MKSEKGPVKYRFGTIIREVRERKGLTLAALAGGAGISVSLVSQIERNVVSPSIDTLLKLADVLEIDLDYLFKDYRRNKKVRVLRSGEGRTMTDPSGVVYRQLSILEEKEKYGIEAVLLEVPPGKGSGSREFGHPGKEMGIILEGQGRFTYGETREDLHPWDTVSFDSDIPHTFLNTGSKPLKAVWILTPPKNKQGGTLWERR